VRPPDKDPEPDPDPDPERASSGVWVSPTFKYQSLTPVEFGLTFVRWGEELTFGFDWAGIGADDFYELRVYRERDYKAERPMDVEKYLPVRTKPVKVSCYDPPTPCQLSKLGMHSDQVTVAESRSEVALTDTVEFTSGGQVLSVAARPNTCGCLIVKYEAKTAETPSTNVLTLTARLHSEERGVVDIPLNGDGIFGFDSAGVKAGDRYSITAELKTKLLDQQKTTPVKIQDYLTLVARLEGLSCTDNGSHIKVHTFDEKCGFGALRMSKVKNPSYQPPAPTPTPPPAKEAKKQ